jgi:hypothetical protein
VGDPVKEWTTGSAVAWIVRESEFSTVPGLPVALSVNVVDAASSVAGSAVLPVTGVVW